MIPELRQLRYFIAVAEELHFSRAARRLNIAQPPLTQQIQSLERTLGVQLFTRTTRRVELTRAGLTFLEGARRALAEAERAGERARRAHRGEVETLRVGFTDAALMSVLPGAIERFRARFPSVHLDLHERAGAMPLDEMLRRGLVDVAFMRGPLLDPTLRVETILEEPFWVALPVQHDLARRARIALASLRRVPLLFFPRRLSPAYYDQLILVCQAAGFTPQITYELDNYTTVLGLIAAGVGATIVPRSNRNLTRAGVVYRPIRGASTKAAVVAAYSPSQPSVALNGLLEAAREAASRDG